MNAIKKRLQTLKLEKDLAMDKADLCSQQAKEANLREEKLRDEVRELAKKLLQMEHDLGVSKGQLVKSNRDLEIKERLYIVVSESEEMYQMRSKFEFAFINYKIADAVRISGVE